MSTIEEAWAGLRKGAKLNARILALAVLEKAVSLSEDMKCGEVGRHDPECHQCIGLKQLRRRIEALP